MKILSNTDKWTFKTNDAGYSYWQNDNKIVFLCFIETHIKWLFEGPPLIFTDDWLDKIYSLFVAYRLPCKTTSH